jgi:large subunit ribosomal protein L9
MEVILLERIERLGQMGDAVQVKNGYARNFLLPQGKALRATQGNVASFEDRRTHLEAQNLERREEAEGISTTLDGQSCVILRQASDGGQLYGSVSARDIAEAVHKAGFTIERRQVILSHPIKILGLHRVRIRLHPEVSVSVTVNVARSEAEAESQFATAAGGVPTVAAEAAEAFFDDPEDVLAAQASTGDEDEGDSRASDERPARTETDG